MESKVGGGGHGSRERQHDMRGLDMEVAEHGIRAPATDEANKIGVNLGAEEGHHPAGAELPGFDVSGA